MAHAVPNEAKCAESVLRIRLDAVEAASKAGGPSGTKEDNVDAAKGVREVTPLTHSYSVLTWPDCARYSGQPTRYYKHCWAPTTMR